MRISEAYAPIGQRHETSAAVLICKFAPPIFESMLINAGVIGFP